MLNDEKAVPKSFPKRLCGLVLCTTLRQLVLLLSYKTYDLMVLEGYPTKKVTQTCQEISNLSRESVKGGLLGCPVRLGLNEVN